MAWSIHEIEKKSGKTYIALKRSYREGKKVKSDYIYLGPARAAAKMLGELQTKPLIDEKEISYSGEMILSKIASSIQFEQVLNNYLEDERAANVLQSIVILRTIFPESKRKLVLKRLEYSILKDSTDLKYLEEVYRFMDKAYTHLGDILYDAIKTAIKKYSLDLEYLIIDATRIKIWRDEETDLIRLGYSGKERRDLPQVNLILGVNKQHVPLFMNTYPGNTHDVEMFDDFVKRIQNRYQTLSKKFKEKFIIFDQGNVNEENIKHLRSFRKQGIYFITMLRSTSLQRFIKKIDPSVLPLIYSREKSKNEKTEVYGKIMKERVYEKMSRILVCYNPKIRERKCKSLDGRVGYIKQMVEEGSSVDDVKEQISKYNLKRAIKPIKGDGGLKLDINKENLDSRKERYGFFALFTDHSKLSAEKIIKIYKGKSVVEEGFRALKSDLEVAPVNHWEDRRVKTHNVLVVCGYLLLSLLRAILSANKINYSFEGLKDSIKSGNAVEGFYEHEQLRSRLHIWRPIKPRDELEEIFKALRIRVPSYDVKESIPTDFKGS